MRFTVKAQRRTLHRLAAALSAVALTFVTGCAGAGSLGASDNEVTIALVSNSQMTDAQKMERNKKNVVAFYNAVLNEKDFEKAKTYVGATYIQHNPIGADTCAPAGEAAMIRVAQPASIVVLKEVNTNRRNSKLFLRNH